MSLVVTLYGRRQMVAAFWTPDIFPVTSQLYVCYTLDVAASNADGSQLEEPSPAAGYGRVPYAMDSSHWAPTTQGEIANSQQINFPQVTAEWGMIFGLAFADSPTVGAGNVYVVGSIPEPFTPELNSSPYLDVGDIAIGLYE